MVSRGGYVGRFSFEFNGMPGILVGIIVGFFSAIISYGYILEILEQADQTVFLVHGVAIIVIIFISWFLQFKLLR
jgi:undecaprenyl pyrophosphate phosphatase UppP